MTWDVRPLAELTVAEVYDLLQLRVDVFVVGQACAYRELDGHDLAPGVEHVRGLRDGRLVACARLLPPGVTYAEASLGRVCVHERERGTGLGHEVVDIGLARLAAQHPGQPILIGAQSHLQAWYEQHGFVTASAEYLEDGIPHVHMRRAATPSVEP